MALLVELTRLSCKPCILRRKNSFKEWWSCWPWGSCWPWWSCWWGRWPCERALIALLVELLAERLLELLVQHCPE